MKTSFVLTIVSLLLLGAVVADIDVCQTSTYELKVEIRALNAWRAACEDYNWKGAACYNYWAQLNEVMTLENNLQTCLTGIFQDQKAYMLGNATTGGAYSQDAVNSRDADDISSKDTRDKDIAEQSSNRAHVTAKTNGVIASATKKLDDETTLTRETVATQYAATKKAERDAHKAMRTLQDDSATRILNTINSQETETRSAVGKAHAATVAHLTGVETQDGQKAREDNKNQEAYSRATHFDEYTATIGLSHTTAGLIQTNDTNEEKETRQTVKVAEDTTRAHSSDEHTQTQTTLNDLLTSVKAEVDAQTAPILASVRSDANETVVANAAASQQTRALYTSLQALLVGSYGAESAAMAEMWSTLIKILIHFDLQGKCEKWSETFTFATMSTIGLNRFDLLRTEALATLTNNEQMYGADKVGWARWYFEQAETRYSQNNFRAAADYYRLSYNSATVSR